MSAGRASSASSVVGGEVLAVLEQVGAVGVERVAREAALQLQVGEEVEDQALEAGVGAGPAPARGRWLDRDRHGGWFSRAAPHPLRRKAGARGERGGEEERVLLEVRPIVRAGRPDAA